MNTKLWCCQLNPAAPQFHVHKDSIMTDLFSNPKTLELMDDPKVQDAAIAGVLEMLLYPEYDDEFIAELMEDSGVDQPLYEGEDGEFKSRELVSYVLKSKLRALAPSLIAELKNEYLRNRYLDSL